MSLGVPGGNSNTSEASNGFVIRVGELSTSERVVCVVCVACAAEAGRVPATEGAGTSGLCIVFSSCRVGHNAIVAAARHSTPATLKDTHTSLALARAIAIAGWFI